MPLFPEFRTELDSLFELAQGRDGAERYVITRYRCSEANLRTELERTGRFSNHVLNDWFGHSGAVAKKHYLQTTEDDFAEAAASGNTGGNKQAETGESAKKAETPKPNKKRPLMPVLALKGRSVYTPEDSNL